MEEKTEKQKGNRHPSEDKPWLFKPGQSGNPAGRPKGVTLKEYCREFLSTQTPEEREEFLSGIPKESIWKMAEGNPANDMTIKGDKDNPIPVTILGDVHKNDGDTEDTKPQE